MSTIDNNNEETESFYLRIKKLAESKAITSSGKEFEGLYELNNKSAENDHALTPIEIHRLLRSIDEIKRPFASKESSVDGEQVSDVLSECKDKRLISILQAK